MIVLFYTNMFPSYGQQTIEVAQLFCVTLFFEESIEKYDIKNAETSYFQIEKDSEMPIVTLTVKPDVEVREHKTNITIVADNGNIYSYILDIVKNPSRLHVKVKKEDAVFNLKKIDKNISENKSINTNYKSYQNKRTKEEYYENKIFYHMEYMVRKPPFHRFRGKNKKVYLFLNGIKGTKNRFFIFFKLENRGVLNFVIKNVELCMVTKGTEEENTSKKKGTASIGCYELPKKVGDRERHFAVVFKKFSVKNKETLCLYINEYNEERNVELIIDGKEMNKAGRL